MKKCKHNWCLMEHQARANPDGVIFTFVCSECLEIKDDFRFTRDTPQDKGEKQ